MRIQSKLRQVLITGLFLTLFAGTASARQGFSVGLGPVGNFYVVRPTPVLDPGVGGFMNLQYRFHQQVAFETTFMITSQDGRSVSGGTVDDAGILLLGMPLFDFKYFFLTENRWDPYMHLGLGMYWLTEGDLGNSTGGVGLGTQIGVGSDYYLSDVISVGLQATFRSAAIITASNNSTGVFPISLMGNIAFHF